VVIGKIVYSFNVSIYDHTIIGDNVIIHAGTILGADAFIIKRGGYDQLLSGGRGCENNVGIGALYNDKELLVTTIGEGTKLTISTCRS
jgi:UDP-3-O-[3-hydroxymyristoyl] glucosamine N-acyltransferase